MNLARILILPVLWCFVVISCVQKPTCDCPQFHDGTYIAVQSIQGKNDTTQIIRKGNEQIETYHGKTDTAIVRWVNDCELIVRPKHPHSIEDRKALSMKIVQTEKNTCLVRYSYVGESKEFEQKMTKIAP
ncbi:MAG: DNA topoisomerase IV [Flavobacterium sp. BFFFF2]|nr:MAG: DNA topoisomerase IV [Flavobacterium sp. BFFFF2]